MVPIKQGAWKSVLSLGFVYTCMQVYVCIHAASRVRVIYCREFARRRTSQKGRKEEVVMKWLRGRRYLIARLELVVRVWWVNALYFWEAEAVVMERGEEVQSTKNDIALRKSCAARWERKHCASKEWKLVTSRLLRVQQCLVWFAWCEEAYRPNDLTWTFLSVTDWVGTIYLRTGRLRRSQLLALILFSRKGKILKLWQKLCHKGK